MFIGGLLRWRPMIEAFFHFSCAMRICCPARICSKAWVRRPRARSVKAASDSQANFASTCASRRPSVFPSLALQACAVEGVMAIPWVRDPCLEGGWPPGSSRSQSGGDERLRAFDVKGLPWAVQRVAGP